MIEPAAAAMLGGLLLTQHASEAIKRSPGVRSHARNRGQSHDHTHADVRIRSHARNRSHDPGSGADRSSRDDRTRSAVPHSRTERLAPRSPSHGRRQYRFERRMPGQVRGTCWLRTDRLSVSVL